MGQRSFKEVATQSGGATKTYQISCSRCGEEGVFGEIKGGRRLPPLAAQQHFVRKGWVVGATHRKDICPTCAALKKEKQMPEDIALKAEPPRTMSREDRRIVNDKLDEVYAKDCYKAGWTDQKVASDLGIPKAWVEEVRTQFFGEAGSNPQIDEFLARAAEIKDEVAALIAKCGEVERLHKEIDLWRINISKQEDELWRIGRRLEKEIGR